MNAINTHVTQLLHKGWTTTKTLKTRNTTDKMSPQQTAPNNKSTQKGQSLITTSWNFKKT